jgi:carbonic anhydrase
MQKLVHGIHHFHDHVFRTRREFFERLAQGQHPLALFITCSDSRVQPNLITQTEPGELFILRNAGNLIPPHGAANGGEGATIEYAVSVLGIEDIIVCGHSCCGAMQSMLEPESVAELPAVAKWLCHADATRRIIREVYGHLEPDKRLTAAVEENVLVQLENLRTHPSVAAGLARGRLKLHGWVYKMETGEVFAYDPASGQFAPLREDSLPVNPPYSRLLTPIS